MSAQRTPTNNVGVCATAARGAGASSMNMTITDLLHEHGQLHAIDASRTSLATPGTSMRQPSNAIAAARSMDRPRTKEPLR
jgi:hypothetical protein